MPSKHTPEDQSNVTARPQPPQQDVQRAVLLGALQGIGRRFGTWLAGAAGRVLEHLL